MMEGERKRERWQESLGVAHASGNVMYYWFYDGWVFKYTVFLWYRVPSGLLAKTRDLYKPIITHRMLLFRIDCT